MGQPDIFGFYIDDDKDIIKQFERRPRPIVYAPPPRMPRGRPEYPDYGEESDEGMGFNLFGDDY
jgi:hypothetical protein